MSKCSTKYAPWFVIPADHKWFRNLAISHILETTLENIGIELPKPSVNLEEIRKKYHQEVLESKRE
jgi:hypothetical protein